MQNYPKLNALVKLPRSAKKYTDTHVKRSITTLSRLLQGGKELGRFHLSLLSGSRTDSTCFELAGGQCRITKDTSEMATFEIRTSKDTWMEMAKGKLSPVDAYIGGKMEVHGDLGFGKRLYAKTMSKRSADQSILEIA